MRRANAFRDQPDRRLDGIAHVGREGVRGAHQLGAFGDHVARVAGASVGSGLALPHFGDDGQISCGNARPDPDNVRDPTDVRQCVFERQELTVVSQFET